MGATAGLSTGAQVGLGLQAAGAGASIVGAFTGASATRDAYAAQAAVDRTNAAYAQQQAQDAISRGSSEESYSDFKYSRLKSSQRAALAASGVSLNEGSPLAVLEDTDLAKDQAASNIRENVNREAAGYIRQRNSFLMEGGSAAGAAKATSPGMAAFSTLLTQGGSVAEKWYGATAKVK